MKTLRVATCQFSVQAEIRRNLRQILRQIRSAGDQGADIVHFSECALSGYAGVDIPDTSAIDWDELVAATQSVQHAARQSKLWVLLGSTHRLSEGNKPHNSVYVIDAGGRIVERYDKRFCTGQGGRKPTLDLCHYTPGNRFVTFTMKRITCSVLICYDYRFPELYRELKRRNVDILFQSFHNARKNVVDNSDDNIWRTIVPATMSCRAAENHFWISANNSTARPSCWGSFAVRPDGLIVRQLPRHRAGMLVTDMHLDPDCFDAPKPWRDAAMNGQLHSGDPVNDERSADVTCL